MRYSRHKYLPFFILLFAFNASGQAFGQDGPNIKKDVEGAIKNVAIYGSRAALATAEELKTFAGDAEIEFVEDEETKTWKTATLKYTKPDRATLTITHLVATDEGIKDIEEFTNFIYQKLADGKMDAHVYGLIRQANRTNHLYVIKADPAMPEASISFVKKFASTTGAFVFTGQEISDANLNLLLGPGKTKSENAKLPSFKSAEMRKSESTKLLAKHDLIPLASLPTIASDEQIRLRDAKSVAKRAVCLVALAAHAESAPKFDGPAFLKKHKVWDSISPQEKAFLEDPALTDRSVVTWRYEAAYTLLWALGKFDTHQFPDKQKKATDSIKIVMEGADDLIANAKLRDQAEILDQADLYYRCYWLCRDAMVKEKKMDKVSASVVYERLYSLNWLIRYMNKKWDETVVDS